MASNELYLEPMTAGMILDRTFRLYSQNFALMIGVTAMVQIPILALTIGAPLVRQFNPILGVLATLVGLMGFLVSFLILTPLATGAATKAISERYLGHDITTVAALKFAWGYLGTLLPIQIIVGIIVMAGAFLLVFPGVFWFLSYILVTPVTVLENSRDGGRVRRRSWRLVDGNRVKAFVVLFVLAFPQLLISMSLILLQASFGTESVMGEVITGVLSGLAGLLLYPLHSIAVTLLYYDLRIRKEAFDLEMMSRALAGAEMPA
jgi:hypothetical protein